MTDPRMLPRPSRPVHETHLEIPFPVERGVAVIRVPREGLTPEDAQRMADMVQVVSVVSVEVDPRAS